MSVYYCSTYYKAVRVCVYYCSTFDKACVFKLLACVFITAVLKYLLQILVLFVCVFITAVPITKLFAWGEEESGGHVL